MVFRKKPSKYVRDRTLTDGKPSGLVDRVLPSQEISGSEQAGPTFALLADNINLANEVLPLFEEKCRATHIPVPEKLKDITAAVKRLDSSEVSGSRISFGLFLTCIKKYEDLKLQYSLKISQSIQGNPDLDNNIAEEIKTKVISGIAEADLDLFTSLLLMNYAASKYQEIFNVPTIMSMVSNPETQAIGMAKLVNAISFAAAIDILNENMLDQINSENTDIEYKGVEEFSRLDQLAYKKISQEDYKVILSYALKYINASTDPKYSPWLAYYSARKARNSSIDKYRMYPTYSNSEFLKANNVAVDENNEDDYVEESFAANFAQKFVENLGLTVDFNDSGLNTYFETNALKDREIINTAVQSNLPVISKDQICCLARTLVHAPSIDSRALNLLKCIFSMASNDMSINISANIAKKELASLTNFSLSSNMSFFAYGIMKNFIDQVNNKILSKFDETFAVNVAAKCGLFDQMLNGLSIAMANIYNSLSSLIDGKEQEEDYSYRNTKIALHGKYKVKFFNDMKQIVGAIDSSQSILQDCIGMSDDIADQAFEDFLDGFNLDSNQYTIKVSDELKGRYFSNNLPIKVEYISEAFSVESDLLMPSVNTLGSPESSEELIRDIIKTCKVQVSDEEIKQMLKDTDGSSR